MAIKPEQLLSWLNQTKLASENNSLYQCIKGLITDTKEILEGFVRTVTFNQFIASTRFVNVVEIDTSSAPVNILLSDYVFINFMVFKDISGNAAVNNITLTGTVDGVVNPVINTNFGYKQIYKSLPNDTLHEW